MTNCMTTMKSLRIANKNTFFIWVKENTNHEENNNKIIVQAKKEQLGDTNHQHHGGHRHMRREDDEDDEDEELHDDYDEAYKSAEKAYSLIRLKGEAWGNE